MTNEMQTLLYTVTQANYQLTALINPTAALAPLVAVLYSCVQIDHNVDGCNKNLGCNKNDD